MLKDAARHDSGALAHILTVDVEDYFQVEAFANIVAKHAWDQWPSRVVNNTERVLDLFARHDVRATFFFLGWVAERFPALVRKVSAAGHELACHSYWHRAIYTLDQHEFREDTRRAKFAIEQAAGVPVFGYRAPTWSITRSCLWALDILTEEGFTYDSSIFPVHHDLYGIPDGRRSAYTHTGANGLTITEIPPTTVRLFGTNMPAVGGGYLRLLPSWYHQYAFRQAHEGEHPVVVYFHPWELDINQPRINGSWRSRFRHYHNLAKTEHRLAKLLRAHSFQRFVDFLPAEHGSAVAAGQNC